MLQKLSLEVASITTELKRMKQKTQEIIELPRKVYQNSLLRQELTVAHQTKVQEKTEYYLLYTKKDNSYTKITKFREISRK